MRRLLTDERGIATVLIVVLIVLGGLVVAIVGTAVVLLSNDVTITVNNQSCGTLDVAKGAAALKFNFLPGINVPSQISEGDTAAFQVPRRFVGSGTVTADSLEVRAFGRSFTLGTSSIDMERSTLDGVPLAGLVGLKAQVSGHHALVLECK